MIETLVLLPYPRLFSQEPGNFILSDDCPISINTQCPSQLAFCANQFKSAVARITGLNLAIAADPMKLHPSRGIFLDIIPDQSARLQGYRLTITPDGVDIRGSDAAGVFYAVQTLVQMISHAHKTLPCVTVEDWPDFPARGVMLDISRDKVPQMKTLFALVDLLSSWKINQLQLYTEHTFAYRDHHKVWEKASPMTGEEILALDAYCQARFIELVPNQNSFGHMTRWLTHPKYAGLSEVVSSFETPWGGMDGPFSLCPEDPASLAFIQSLYDELLPYFNSRIVNVGCDETFDVGQGRSRAACEARGAGTVYLDYVKKIYLDLKRRGCTMQFWGDIILQHPELVTQIPRDAIALEWGYEADHPFEQHGEQFAAAGIPFYVCPGTSTWNTIAGKTDNALGNLLNAADNGLKHGAVGYLITDWGDNGHWQPLPVSYLGFAAGAAYAWCVEANRGMDIRPALNHFAFQDKSHLMGEIVYQLGNLYQMLAFQTPNSTAFFGLLQYPLAKIKEYSEKMPPGVFNQPLEAIAQAEVDLEKARLACPDAEVVKREYQLVLRLLKHACLRGMLAISTHMAEQTLLRETLKKDLDEILVIFPQVWLLRNRAGGLADSLARFKPAQEDLLTHPGLN
jgi:hexosaminidase